MENQETIEKEINERKNSMSSFKWVLLNIESILLHQTTYRNHLLNSSWVLAVKEKAIGSILFNIVFLFLFTIVGVLFCVLILLQSIEMFCI